MKVSIITLYSANNIGAYLQAFSLQKVVESVVGEGNSSFVRFVNPATEQGEKIKKAGRYLKQLKLRHVVFKYRTVQKYRSAAKCLHIDEQVFSPDREYETVIVGSDEVWNCASTRFIHHEQYFAKNLKANNMIAYAPCAGSTTVDMLWENGVDFSGFHHLSVRDKKTYNLVRSIDKREPTFVCDPTLLIDSFSPYIDQTVPIREKGYILVYSYGLKRQDTLQITKFARKHNKKLISVGNFNPWCDKNIVVDPFEFLTWIQSADMVVTSTFHGAVLSVKLHKQVAVYAGENHKVKYFLEQMDLENRCVSETRFIEDVFAHQMDYDAVERKIAHMKAASMTYLREALQDCGN